MVLFLLLSFLKGSKEAGAKLLEMLRLGKSKPWKEVMEIMTGTPKMDTGAYREYFAPLEKWLIKKNKEENNKV
jgi:peptidyl-dipeptidase A